MKMTLLEAYQKHLLSSLNEQNVIVMGENVNNGSKISGLGANLGQLPNARILNIGNCELTHVGVGMGVMLEGGNLVLMVKQLDFLLLGLDQMVNTLNWIRVHNKVSEKTLGSFTIITYICDQGYQGPQSSMVDLTGFCSLGGFPGYILQEYHQIEAVLQRELNTPGFRIIGIPQKSASRTVANENACIVDDANGVRVYGENGTVCIVSCHSTFRYAIELRNSLECKGYEAVVTLNDIVPGSDPSAPLSGLTCLKHLVVMDDAKGLVKWGDYVAKKFNARFPALRVTFLERQLPIDYSVNPDDPGLSPAEVEKMLQMPE